LRTAQNPVNFAEVARAYHSKEHGVTFSARSSRGSSEPGGNSKIESKANRIVQSGGNQSLDAKAAIKMVPKMVTIAASATPAATSPPPPAAGPFPTKLKSSIAVLTKPMAPQQGPHHGFGGNGARLTPKERKQLDDEHEAEEERKQSTEDTRLKFNAELDAIEDEMSFYKDEMKRIEKDEKRQRQLEKKRRKLDKHREKERRHALKKMELDARLAKETQVAEVVEPEVEEEDDISELDEEEIKRIEDEKKAVIEAACNKRASHGRFTGDVKIICASGLPKVDETWWYAGSIDPYIVVKFNGLEISRTPVKKGSMR
jgi:hypothetical protein